MILQNLTQPQDYQPSLDLSEPDPAIGFPAYTGPFRYPTIKHNNLYRTFMIILTIHFHQPVLNKKLFRSESRLKIKITWNRETLLLWQFININLSLKTLGKYLNINRIEYPVWELF
jgi:hypothetical protein